MVTSDTSRSSVPLAGRPDQEPSVNFSSPNEGAVEQGEGDGHDVVVAVGGLEELVGFEADAAAAASRGTRRMATSNEIIWSIDD